MAPDNMDDWPHSLESTSRHAAGARAGSGHRSEAAELHEARTKLIAHDLRLETRFAASAAETPRRVDEFDD